MNYIYLIYKLWTKKSSSSIDKDLNFIFKKLNFKELWTITLKTETRISKKNPIFVLFKDNSKNFMFTKKTL